MALEELFETGIALQGDTIKVKYWNNLLSVFGGAQVVAETTRQLYMGDVSNKYLSKEVKYIYQEDKTLVIELGD